MDFDQLQALVLKHIGEIEINRDAILDARNRAARFLVIQSHLNDHMKILADVKVKASTEEKATYAQAILSAGGKNVTEGKIIAEANPIYAKARETVELIDSEFNWTKKHYEIFENAHIMFRQIASERQ